MLTSVSHYRKTEGDQLSPQELIRGHWPNPTAMGVATRITRVSMVTAPMLQEACTAFLSHLNMRGIGGCIY